MTLTKKGIVDGVIDKVHLKNRKRERQQFLFPELNYSLLSRKRANDLVDALLEIIKKNLEKGENVFIPGFGKFKVRFKWARKGTNPHTGKSIILKSRRTVVFRCSSRLKDRINRNQ